MITEVKNVLLQEIKSNVERYEEIKERINYLKIRKLDLEASINSFVKRDGIERITPPNLPALVVPKFSFLDKILLKRKEFKEIKRKNEEVQKQYDIDLKEYNKKINEIETEINSVTQELSHLAEQFSTISATKEKFERIKSAQTLKELGMSFEEAKELLKSKGIPLVLNNEDKIITQNESNFDKIEDFILVHKTEYFPTDNQVKPLSSSGAEEKHTILWNNDEFSYSWKKARNTVHFCQNGEVSSHKSGHFDGRRYAILIPFKHTQQNKPIAFAPADTFFDGNVNIISGYILCPNAEVEKIQKLNTGCQVIGYEGNSVDEYADSLLSTLGYKQEEVSEHGWSNEEDQGKSNLFSEKSNLNHDTHANSQEFARDDLLDKFYEFIGFTESIITNKNNGKRYEIDSLLHALTGTIQRKIISESGKIQYETIAEASSVSTRLHLRNLEGIGIERNLFLKDIIDEDLYTDEFDNPTDSNIHFLIYELKKNFNIDISQNIENLLRYRSEDNENLQEFCEMILDNETKQYINELIKNRTINSISDAQDTLLIRTIIQQIYEKDIKLKNSNIVFKLKETNDSRTER